jgi:hypothetical protein
MTEETLSDYICDVKGLKTLKDICVNDKGSFYQYDKDLQKEAIKWIKLCKEDLRKTNNNDKEEIMFLNGEIFAFEHFFNIKEEEKT